jgi:hypothetical protein
MSQWDKFTYTDKVLVVVVMSMVIATVLLIAISCWIRRYGGGGRMSWSFRKQLHVEATLGDSAPKQQRSDNQPQRASVYSNRVNSVLRSAGMFDVDSRGSAAFNR